MENLFKLIKRNSHDAIPSIRTLLLQGEKINALDSNGNTLLHVAVISGCEKTVKLLIDSEVDVNIKNDRSKTALHIAIDCFNLNSKTTIIKLLVDARADINVTCKLNGFTLLHAAAMKMDIDLVRVLISRGIDVNAKDVAGWTALHYAAANVVNEDTSLFDALLAAKAKVNAKNSLGLTPLQSLAIFKPKLSCTSLRKIVNVFSSYGADFNATDEAGWTPLELAVQNLNSKAVEAFVTCGGVDVNSRFKFGNEKTTILHQACSNLDISTVKILLKNGVDINALDNYNVSPLQCAIDSVNLNKTKHNVGIKLVKYLLKWNADVNTFTRSGYNILTSLSNDNPLPKYLWQTILQHIAKLHMIKRPIHANLLQTISQSPKYDSYFKLCIEELQIVKNTQLHIDSWVTFLNFLMDDKSKLVKYCRNRNLNKILRTRNKISTEFLIYGALIDKRLLKAAKTGLIWKESEKALSRFLPISVKPGHPVIAKILSYLKTRDLQKLSLKN